MVRLMVLSTVIRALGWSVIPYVSKLSTFSLLSIVYFLRIKYILITVANCWLVPVMRQMAFIY